MSATSAGATRPPEPEPTSPSSAATDTPERARFLAAVITCSDSADQGVAPDMSGPLAAELLADLGHDVTRVTVVPDEILAIVDAVRDSIAVGARIVVATGGTGVGPRDVTPEALRSMGLRELPGLGEAIRASSRERIPATDLSRALGGIVDGAVLLALPGSPGGVRDGLAAVGALLEHAADVAGGAGHPGQRTGASPASVGLVRAAPITEAEVCAEVSRTDAGAVVTFAGVVRDRDHGRSVTALHYEGHPDAGHILSDVLTEALDRPGVLAAAARHRIGDLAIGDLAFVAAVSAAHRREAFDACAWLVDEAKSRLPIWKHQHFADGTDEWVNSP